MRKLISILIIGVMVFGTGTMAFATGTEQSTPRLNNIAEKAALSTGFQALQPIRAELETLRAEIKTNHNTLEILRQELVASRIAIKDVLKILKDNRGNLGADQISTLKTILADLKTIKIDRKAIHDGVFKIEIQNLKVAREVKDFEAAKTAMTNILTEQKSRITELAAIKERLQVILTNLEKI